MTGIRVERINVMDAGEMLTLQRAAYASEARIYGDPDLPALTQTLAELVAEVNSESVACRFGLKALSAHRMVGAVRARVDGELIHIGRLTVAPDRQGEGIGSLLLDELEGQAPVGVTRAALFTGHLSAANLRLYLRRGYLETHREELRPGVILVHLAKSLR